MPIPRNELNTPDPLPDPTPGRQPRSHRPVQVDLLHRVPAAKTRPGDDPGHACSRHDPHHQENGPYKNPCATAQVRRDFQRIEPELIHQKCTTPKRASGTPEKKQLAFETLKKDISGDAGGTAVRRYKRAAPPGGRGEQTLLNTSPAEHMNPLPRGAKVNDPGASSPQQTLQDRPTYK